MSANSKEKKSLKFLRLAGACGILGSVLPLVMVLSATFHSLWFKWERACVLRPCEKDGFDLTKQQC